MHAHKSLSHMGLMGLVLFHGIGGCFIAVPDLEDALFRCKSDDDCDKDYECRDTTRKTEDGDLVSGRFCQEPGETPKLQPSPETTTPCEDGCPTGALCAVTSDQTGRCAPACAGLGTCGPGAACQDVLVVDVDAEYEYLAGICVPCPVSCSESTPCTVKVASERIEEVAVECLEAELIDCQVAMNKAQDSAAADTALFFGAYFEAPESYDPTRGIVLAALPLQDGPMYGNMMNTYFDCEGQMGAGGTYAGQRTGLSANGTWTIRLAAGEFGGSWSGTVGGVNNDKIVASYLVSSGSTRTDVPCNNPDSTSFGVDGCYCLSPGTFEMRPMANGNADSTANIPFSVQQSGTVVQLISNDNPNTATDESDMAQEYMLFDLQRVCSRDLPMVAFCPNASGQSPLNVSHSAACTISLPFVLGPAAIEQLMQCPCLFFRDLTEGHHYVAVGVHDSDSSGGMFSDFEELSYEVFEYAP